MRRTWQHVPSFPSLSPHLKGKFDGMEPITLIAAWTAVWIGAALVVAADLGLGPHRRRLIAESARALWAGVAENPLSRSVGCAAEGTRAGFGRFLGPGGRLRHHLGAGTLAALIGGGVLVAGAFAVSLDPRPIIVHGIRYFGAPVVFFGWAMLSGTSLFAGLIGRARSLAGQGLLLLVHGAGAAGMWVMVVHAGTWIEWQEKSTPIPYGTEFFYAEVYMNYVREPIWWPVTAAATAVVALPAAALIVPVLLTVIGKLLHPVAAPASRLLLGAFEKAPRGLFSVIAGGGLAALLTIFGAA